MRKFAETLPQRNLCNIVLFQVFWWTFVLLLDANSHLYMVAAFATYLALHLILVSMDVRKEVLLIALITFFGFSHDSLFAYLGGMDFPRSDGTFAPYWMLLIWLMFSTTIAHSLQALAERRVFALFGAAIGGPASYLVAQNFGLLQYSQPETVSLAIHGLIWAAQLQLFFFLHRKLFRDIDPAGVQRESQIQQSHAIAENQ